MKMFPNFPSEDNYDNWEIFNHDNYLKSNDEDKKKIRRLSCKGR